MHEINSGKVLSSLSKKEGKKRMLYPKNLLLVANKNDSRQKFSWNDLLLRY
jgi:hypothetical protein